MGILQFDSRKNYFDGCGTEITGAQKTDVVLKLAGLDYTVSKEPLMFSDGTIAEGCFANRRNDNGKVLGPVGARYEVLQNYEAFDFLDSFADNGAEFVNAGCIQDGKKTYIVAKTEPMKILGDEFDPYILFTNSFDGTTGIQAMFTPIRVICSNCFVAATRQANHKITIKHSKSMKDKLMIARDTMLENTKYLEYLKEKSEQLAVTKFTAEQFESVIEELLPIKADCTDGIRDRQEMFRDALRVAYNQEDLQNYNGTAYKAIMAVSDVDSHKAPARNTGNPFVQFTRVLGGMEMLNQAGKAIARRLGVSTLF